MALLKNGVLIEDQYKDVSGDDIIPPTGQLIVSLDQWQAHRDTLAARPEALGIVLHSHEKAEAIQDDLASFAVVALDFPAFGDGRAYSTARLLRDRCGYDGEIRAVGEVLLEQLHYMNRVGFNAYDVASDDAQRDWEIAAADISVWYQPTGDGRTTVIEMRHDSD